MDVSCLGLSSSYTVSQLHVIKQLDTFKGYTYEVFRTEVSPCLKYMWQSNRMFAVSRTILMEKHGPYIGVIIEIFDAKRRSWFDLLTNVWQLCCCSFSPLETLYGWIIVFVLPINSALNPILYTMSTTSFTQWFHRQLKRGKCKANASVNGYLNATNMSNSWMRGGRWIFANVCPQEGAPFKI